MASNTVIYCLAVFKLSGCHPRFSFKPLREMAL